MKMKKNGHSVHYDNNFGKKVGIYVQKWTQYNTCMQYSNSTKQAILLVLLIHLWPKRGLNIHQSL